MKLHFQNGWMYYLDTNEGEEDETPTLMGHPVPAPTEERTVDTLEFQTVDASSEEGQAAVSALLD